MPRSRAEARCRSAAPPPLSASDYIALDMASTVQHSASHCYGKLSRILLSTFLTTDEPTEKNESQKEKPKGRDNKPLGYEFIGGEARR